MAAIRIWFQSAVEMDAASPIARPHRHTASIVQLGTTVDVFGVPPGRPAAFRAVRLSRCVRGDAGDASPQGRAADRPALAHADASPEMIDLFVSRLP